MSRIYANNIFFVCHNRGQTFGKIAVLFFVILLNGCISVTQKEIAVVPSDSQVKNIRTAFQYLLQNWASSEQGDQRRGYNIAAVLVDPSGEIVAKELNRVLEKKDCTQHAEMRLIQNYIRKHRCFNLKGYTIYTTLEPCAMCTATMSMSGIEKVYYGQSDPIFGKSAERLSLDSFSQKNGFPPYARTIQSIPVDFPMRKMLEASFSASGVKEITRWLASNEARHIIEDAFSND